MLLLFVDAPAPIERSGNLLASRVRRNLLIEESRSFSELALAIVQPSRSPVAAWAIAAPREKRRHLAIVVDRTLIILTQQVHISAGIERLCEPRTLRKT